MRLSNASLYALIFLFSYISGCNAEFSGASQVMQDSASPASTRESDHSASPASGDVTPPKKKTELKKKIVTETFTVELKEKKVIEVNSFHDDAPFSQGCRLLRATGPRTRSAETLLKCFFELKYAQYPMEINYMGVNGEPFRLRPADQSYWIVFNQTLRIESTTRLQEGDQITIKYTILE